MKVIITGGGTAGHINPALSIAEYIRETYPEAEILYVGTERGLESDLAARAGFRFEAISVRGFRRKLSLDTFRTAGALMTGLRQAWSLLGREKPDLVIGTGGYVCGPVVYLAAKKKIRTLIHEQNVFPGATNRILSRSVNCVCVAYPESENLFSKAKRVAVTGNPVKKAFVGLNRDACRQVLGLESNEKLILSLGGSGGAAAINNAVRDAVESVPQNVRWTHITGKNYYVRFEKDCPPDGWPKGVKILPFSYTMPELMGAADLIVSRAGALTLAELATAGVPAVLIPSPNVAHDHQTHNAEACRQAGYAEIILDAELTGEVLADMIFSLLADAEKMQSMRLAAAKATMAGSVSRIGKEIEALLKAGRS